MSPSACIDDGSNVVPKRRMQRAVAFALRSVGSVRMVSSDCLALPILLKPLLPLLPRRDIASGAAFIVYRGMFSHVVIFWTDPSKPDAPDELIGAAEKYLASIPGVVNFHVGKMVTSHRDVVDQTYQVALNIQFQSKQAQDEYQDHPQHLEFVKECKPLFAKLVVYDFE